MTILLVHSIILICIFCGVLKKDPINIQEKQYCLNEFEDYYRGAWSGDRFEQFKGINTPLQYPWTKVISTEVLLDKNISSLVLVQQKTDRRYLWFNLKRDFLIYDEKERNWNFVAGNILYKGTTLKVDNLVELENGAIFGLNFIAENSNLPLKTSIPVLSKYDVKTNSFYVLTVLYQSIEKNLSDGDISFYKDMIAVNNNLLIGISNDGLYQYQNDGIEKIVSLNKIHVQRVIGSSNSREIYIKARNPIRDRTLSKLFILGDIYKIVLSDSKIFSMKFVTTKMPYANSLILDEKNNLWYGWFGYFDHTGIWFGNTKEIDAYIQGGRDKDIQYGDPVILFQAKNGLLWFVRNSESGYDGLGWYDPIAQNGCQVTRGGNLLQDKSGNLWTIDYGGLYMLKLENQ